jgi:hypothetical protein
MTKTLKERSGFSEGYIAKSIQQLKNMTPEQEEEANRKYRETFKEFVPGQYAEVAMNREAMSLTCAALLETLLYQDKVHTLDDTMILTSVGSMMSTMIVSCESLHTLAALHAIMDTLKGYTEARASQLFIKYHTKKD